MLPVSVVQDRKATRADPILSKVVTYLKSEWPMTLSDPVKPFSAIMMNSPLKKSVYYREYVLLYPRSYNRKYVLTMLNEVHTMLNEVHVGMAKVL